jgi:imidazole glycerol-phosphate synthase subunit HisH
LIKVVDFGLGNVCAFLNVFRRLGVEASSASTPAELASATKIVLPGVGAFDHAMGLLEESGLRPMLDDRVLGDRIPVLGVCVGMQIMATGSDEGSRSGLNWIGGRVRALADLPSISSRTVPHMGWNTVTAVGDHPLLRGFDHKPSFYFLHSYYPDCDDRAHVAATVNYGQDLPCSIVSGNVLGVLFHPEKSHHSGAMLLRRFAEL